MFRLFFVILHPKSILTTLLGNKMFTTMKKIILLALAALSLSACYYRPATPVGSFARGADISWLSEMEHDSVPFYDLAGHNGDAVTIMQNMGMNAIRLRVWVHHATGWSNRDDVVSMALRAAKQGLRIMIDFHYSDFFADPHHQTIPAAWQNYSYQQLCDAVQEHTLDVLYALKEAGVRPEWVQIGNETPNGMLWPTGKLINKGENINDCWTRYAGFTAVGYKAAKEAFPDVKVIVHVDNAYEYRDWFFRAMLDNGGRFDMIGLSHYPMMTEWSGLPWQEMNERAEQNIRRLIATFHCPVMISEVGMLNDPWPAANYDSIADLSQMVMQDFLDRISEIDSCMGIFYWEPQCYGGWRPAEYIPLGWAGYNMGSFTPEGKPSSALQAMMEFAPSHSTLP